jgi:hypothetical protein
MPRAKLPKLKIGAKTSISKVKSSSAPNRSKFYFQIAAGVLLIVAVGLIALLLWTVAKDDTKDKKGSQSSRRVRRAKIAQANLDKIDREKDREEPKALPASVNDQRKNGLSETPAPDPPATAPGSTPSDPAKAQDGLSFHVDRKSEMDKQFSTSGVNSSQKNKILASQLGRESVLPKFSVERQPSRQIGMSYDMVYQALRGDDKVQRSFGAQVPFGGSEFQEMQRQMRG